MLPPPAFTKFSVTTPGCGPSDADTLLRVDYDTVNAVNVAIYVNGEYRFQEARTSSSVASTYFVPSIACRESVYEVQIEATNARDEIAILNAKYRLWCYYSLTGALYGCT